MSRPVLRRTRKASHGEGHISYRKKEGRWRWTITANGKTYEKKSKDKQEVLEFKDNVRLLLARGRTPPRSMRLSELAALWFKSKQAGGDWSSQMTTKAHQYQLSLILPRLGHIRVDKLNVAHIESLYAELLETRASATVNQTARTMKNILGWAWKRDLISDNVASKASSPSPAARPKVILSETQAKALVQRCSSIPDGLVIEMLLLTGLRVKELRNLQWSDISLDDGTLTVSVSKGRTAGLGRVIPLEQGLRDKLPRHRASQYKNALRLGPEWHDGGYVFCSGVGTQLDIMNFRNRVLNPILDELDLPRVNLHSFRHYFGSYLIRLGATLTEVCVLMGHSNPSTTARLYLHELNSDFSHLSRKLSAIRTG